MRLLNSRRTRPCSHHFALPILVATLIGLTPPPVAAQSSRLELGRRLQRFEIAFENAPEDRRAAALKPLKTAVNSFFSLRLAEAGKQLDAAWIAVRTPPAAPSPLEQSVIGLQIIPSPVCADSSHQSLNIKLDAFYDTPYPPPADAALSLHITDTPGKNLAQTTIPLSIALAGATWNHPELPPGDHQLHATIQHNSESFTLPSSTLSRVPNFAQRIQQLEKHIAASTKTPTPEPSADSLRTNLVNATLKSTLATASALQKNRLQETDYPILDRITFCEQLADPNAPADTILQHARTADTWISLARGNKSVPVRLRAPQQTDNPTTPLPVLFLFHGAGGSENMFFETYGAGRAVREATSRGWLVVAPGQGLLGLALDLPDLLNALETSFPIDRSKVMLLGHSMGAAQVIRQVQKHPNIPVAAVALGGGNRFTPPNSPSPGNTSHPTPKWFVAAGSDDFGKPGALQLHRSLTAANLPSTYREYQRIEHLAIVQVAIPEAFNFLQLSLP